MGNLKPGWRRVKFGEVVRLNKETCKDLAADSIERFIGLEHIEPGELHLRSWGDASEGTTFTNRVRPGQVLFGKRRAYQRKIAVSDFDAVCSGDIYVFESARPETLLPDLVPFICQTDAFFDYAVGTSAGSLSPRTNWSSLSVYEFALPPLAEQLRITALLGAAHAAAVAHQRLAESLTKLPDALMSEFLRTTLGDDRPALFSSAEVRGETVLRKAGDVLRARQGLQIAQGERSRTPGPGLYPYLNAQYLQHGGSVEYVPATSERVICSPQDVLILRTGSGNGGVFTDLSGVFHNNFFAVDYDPKVLERDFLVAYLRHPNVRHLMKTLSGTTAIPDLNHGDFYSIPFPVPPIAKQRDLVAQYNNLCAAAVRGRVRYAEARQLPFDVARRVME